MIKRNHLQIRVRVRVFNATFNNISVFKSWFIFRIFRVKKYITNSSLHLY